MVTVADKLLGEFFYLNIVCRFGRAAGPPPELEEDEPDEEDEDVVELITLNIPAFSLFTSLNSKNWPSASTTTFKSMLPELVGTQLNVKKVFEPASSPEIGKKEISFPFR